MFFCVFSTMCQSSCQGLFENKILIRFSLYLFQEYSKKLNKVIEVQREIKNHLKNLPDLKQLPDVTGGLAPLPSAGDLFSAH